MDDRDFVYWLFGLLESHSDETLASEQIESIIENIFEVYSYIQKEGIVNDFDALRIISFIEGSLMYYDEADFDYQEKVCNLIKNEVSDLYFKYRDTNDEKLPLFRFSNELNMLGHIEDRYDGFEEEEEDLFEEEEELDFSGDAEYPISAKKKAKKKPKQFAKKKATKKKSSKAISTYELSPKEASHLFDSIMNAVDNLSSKDSKQKTYDDDDDLYQASYDEEEYKESGSEAIVEKSLDAIVDNITTKA